MKEEPKVFLEMIKRGVRFELMDKWAEVIYESGRDVSRGATIIHMVAQALGQTLEEIHYPATWWQAFKQHFFPRWLLRWFPVEYTKYKVVTFYPKIAMPSEPHWTTII